MSSSQQSSLPENQAPDQNPEHDQDDHTMMEAPDSPPDTQSVSASSQPFSSAQQPTSQSSGGSRSNTEAKLNHGAPGSSWNNKKFYEEYERVYAQVIDQSWDNTKYGDPLLK